MTVIVGADYGAEILVLADTRVSFGKQSKITPKDQLIKLVVVNFLQREAVLGFSGNIAYAKSIIESLRRRAKYFKSSGDLKEDFRRWIEDAIRMKRPRCRIQLLLCDFDPAEEAHIYVYDVEKNGQVHLQPQGTIEIIGPGGHPGRGRVAVIGSGGKLKQKIYEAMLRPFGDPRRYNDFEAFSKARSLMAVSIVADEFESTDSQDVGGPFTVARLRPDGLIEFAQAWPIGGGDTSDVQLIEEDKKVILFKPSTGEKYTLYQIFDYTRADFAQYSDASASATAQSPATAS